MKPSTARVAAAAAILLAGCAGARTSPMVPPGIHFVSRAEWGAKPPVLPMRAHSLGRLTIHHTGTNQNPARSVSEKLQDLQLFSQRDDSLASGRRKPAWADVPYHFYVAVDGAVGEGRDWRYAGDSNTAYDPAGHLLVVVEGNFQRDTLTSAQRSTLDALIPALARRFRIPAGKLASHRDYAQTECPGANLYAELPRYRALIGRAQR
ncbi:MAG TPA: N-acetylmuramoyl-L-alanine amidase [Gemmatimonadaceae bacterium]|nr:N-acetylmuramoyl-L-alanine amidase [Gemmatimonadaceae bacterium]